MNEQLRRAPSPDLLPRFAAIVGDKYAITDPAALEPFLVEGRGLYHGRSSMLLWPGSIGEVQAILKLANETKTPLVPQGGNTGLVGGQVPFNGEVLLWKISGSVRLAGLRWTGARSRAAMALSVPTCS